MLETEAPDLNDRIRLKVASLDDPDRRPRSIVVAADLFRKDKSLIPAARLKQTDEFDYAYALTVHKAQGSQWGSVLIIDESLICEDPNRWLYTAITRASRKAVVVRVCFRAVADRVGGNDGPGKDEDDPVAEKFAVSEVFNNIAFNIDGRLKIAIVAAKELMWHHEGRRESTAERMRQAFICLTNRGAFTYPDRTTNTPLLHGRFLLEAFRKQIADAFTKTEQEEAAEYAALEAEENENFQKWLTQTGKEVWAELGEDEGMDEYRERIFGRMEKTVWADRISGSLRLP